MSPNHSPITEFCEKRNIPHNMRDAFSAYVRSVYADRFDIRVDTDTVRMLTNKLTEEQIEISWINFINDFKEIMPSSQ